MKSLIALSLFVGSYTGITLANYAYTPQKPSEALTMTNVGLWVDDSAQTKVNAEYQLQPALGVQSTIGIE